MRKESNQQFDRGAGKLISDLELQQKELERQNEELRRALTQAKAEEQVLREQVEHYQTVIENSSVGVCIVGLDGSFISVNETMCVLMGYSKTELSGMTFSSITHPDDTTLGATLLERLVSGELQKGSIEKRYVRKNGSTIWGSVSVSLLRGQHSEPQYFVTHIQDITDRKQAEEERLRNEALFETAIANLPLIFFLIDLDGRFKLSIGAGLKGLGLQPNQVVGLSVFDIYKDFPDILNAIERALAGESVSFESHVAGATFLNYGVGYKDIRGMNSGVAAVALDITERKRTEEALSVSKSLLFQAQKVQSIGTLAGGIAHDFNNILGIILGYTLLLESYRTDLPKFNEHIAVITTAVERGAALVQQILTYARKADVEFKPLNIPDLIGELVGMLKETFPRSVTFREHYEPDLPTIVGDRAQLHQALLNLCVNARDAMPNGGTIAIAVELLPQEAVHRKFSATSEEAYLCIKVSDTGIGMDEATRLRVFDPFFTTKDKGKGTGLGLSVVYGITQSHCGFIDVESAPGQGAVFSLYLPVIQSAEASHASKESAVSPIVGGRETILVVEDEGRLMDMICKALQSKGYTVLTADDGQKAIDRFSQDRLRIDAVITDIGLPIMSGISVFKRMKEIDPQIRVILASGYFEPGTREELEGLGARGFINKPYKTDDLLRLLRHVLDADDSAN